MQLAEAQRHGWLGTEKAQGPDCDAQRRLWKQQTAKLVQPKVPGASRSGAGMLLGADISLRRDRSSQTCKPVVERAAQPAPESPVPGCAANKMSRRLVCVICASVKPQNCKYIYIYILHTEDCTNCKCVSLRCWDPQGLPQAPGPGNIPGSVRLCLSPLLCAFPGWTECGAPCRLPVLEMWVESSSLYSSQRCCEHVLPWPPGAVGGSASGVSRNGFTT